jgi:hypothetical protein
MSLDNLLSKVTAGGLAAGVFLLWWPTHLPSSGAQWLVLRGLAWALAFEVLVLAFAPLERMAAGALARRRAVAQARRVRGALAAAPAPARKGGAVLLAFTGLLIPALMLAHTGRPAKRPAAQPTTIVRKVVVRRQVVRRETVIVRAPAAPVSTYAAPAPAAKSAKPKASDTRSKPEPKIEPAAEQPAPKATTTVPADPATVAQPAEAAAPAPDAAADPVSG